MEYVVHTIVHSVYNNAYSVHFTAVHSYSMAMAVNYVKCKM